MANPTTNYGFVLPTPTDLVTDLPADFDVALQGVDTRLKALQPGTTLGDLAYSSATANTNTRLGIGTAGQVLAVSGGVPAWTTTADVTPLTTKGDLFTFTTVDARLAVGNNGETLVADASTSTGLRYQGSQAAGKNILINGGFDIWQRGTSSATSGAYTTADRWYMNAASTTFSQETTTVPTGVRYALKALTSGTTTVQFRQAIETLNAIQFAGKTVVLSGEYQASTTTTIQTKLFYSTSVDVSVTGSWTEITATTGGTVSAVNGSYTKSSSVFAVPSTAKSLMVLFDTGSVASAVSLYYGKIQLELGSVATEFERTGGTIQGELAACQRYYFRQNWAGETGYGIFGSGSAYSTTQAACIVVFPTPMRVRPTAIDYPTPATFFDCIDTAGNGGTISTLSFDANQTLTTSGFLAVTNGAANLTAYRPVNIRGRNSTAAYIGWTAEL
jgi:hypothetical protein